MWQKAIDAFLRSARCFFGGIVFQSVAEVAAALVDVELLLLAFEDAFVFFDFNHESVNGQIVEAAIAGELEGNFPNSSVMATLLLLNLGNVEENLNDLPCSS